jgi:protein-disulfide isomerase
LSNKFLISILVLMAIIGGVIITSKKKNDPATTSTVQPSSHVIGVGTGNVTLTEYGDFECPSCARFHPILKEVKSFYGDQIKFQFKHFPLTEIHQNALLASRASEAAHMQGKFWEMHDKLFETQNIWKSISDPTSIFTNYAQELGLDTAKFTTDLKGSDVNDIIRADREEAKGLDLTGTPSFLINGQKIENPDSLDGFKKAIDEALAKNKTQ